MRNQFLPEELGLRLVELGFNKDECLYFSHPEFDELLSVDYYFRLQDNETAIGLILWQQALEWAMTTHSIVLSTDGSIVDEGTYFFYSVTIDGITRCSLPFEGYKECREECVKELIRVIEKKIVTSN
jgi:hypothetical protein